MRTLVCRHCGNQVLRNNKLKHRNQQYCGDKACQAARRLSFDRHKYKTDSAYRSDKLQRARDRKKKLADQGDPMACSRYQRAYRASHPDYVAKNRQKQQARNARRAKKSLQEAKIVNPDALMPQPPDNKAVYMMIEVDYQKIVNPDALMPYPTDIKPVTTSKPMFVRLL